MNFGDTRLPERFWDKVIPEPNSGCWLWLGSTGSHGYGQLAMRPGPPQPAHRLIASVALGSVDGLFVCHKCDTRPCVNPQHLMLGDAKMNSLDMVAKGRNRNQNHGKTHCPYGHPFAGDNLYLYGTRRHCRTCIRASSARHRIKRGG